MRKTAICLFFTLWIFCFAACSFSAESHLDMSRYQDDFKEKNSILFLNSECEHLLIHSGGKAILDPIDAALYHQTSCKWGGCDYIPIYEPHVFEISVGDVLIAAVHYKENGYLYHSFYLFCEECHNSVMVHVLCQTQNLNCGKGEGAINGPAECFIGCDWTSIFHDTPYKIMMKE